MIFNILLSLIALTPDTAYSDWEHQGIDLGQVVVTATRTPKLLSESPIQTQVIPMSDIRKLDVANVEDLLRQQMPGVEFSYSMNMQTSMNMAGFAGQSVLFLVDGERLAGETNDNVDFERLVTTNVDHIEIVKGAASALYGSSANGGVINIITRNVAQLPRFSLDANGRLGSHGVQRYSLGLNVHRGRVANSLDGSCRTTDCFGVHNREDDALPLRIEHVPGQEVWNLRDRLVWMPTDRLRLTGRVGYYQRQMVRTPGEAEHTRYYDYTAGLRADAELTPADHLELSYNFDQYDKTLYYVPSSLTVARCNVRQYSNVQNSVRCLWNHTLASGTFTVGADYMYDYLVNGKLASADYHQSSADAFVQYDWNVSRRWELVGALRYDYFELGHSRQVTPKLSAAWHCLRRLTLRGSYGMGFRAPTLKEMFYDFEAMSGWIIDGNPDLKPERSHNFNLSADYGHGPFGFTLMGCHNIITDRITTGTPQRLTDGAHLPYVNLHRAQVSGLEATAQARWRSGVSARLSYCFTAEHKPGQAPNQFMPARPHSLTYSVDYERSVGAVCRFCIALSGRWLAAVSNREYVSTQHPEEGIRRVHYPGYQMHKLQLSQHWRDRLTLTLSADNLLDYHPDNYFYNAPLTTGREYAASLSVHF